MPIQKDFFSRLGPTKSFCDGYGVVTSRTGDGNLTATFTGLVVDMGPSGQAPKPGLSALFNIPQTPVFGGTANATSYDLAMKVEWADTGTPGTTTLGTIRHTDTFSAVNVTSAAPKTATVNGNSVTLPQVFKGALANVPHEFARISATVTANGGTAPTINYGASSFWFDDAKEDHPYALTRVD